MTSTFQKNLNLYLYIPPHSAHPPSCLKGLINDELLRYWTQNPNPNDFQTIVSKFIIRLLDRGHTLQSLTPLLIQAATRIEQGQIRKIYNETLHPALDYDHMQVAVSRPKNHKNILTRSTLTLPPDINLSEVIKQCRDKIQANI